LQHVTRRRTIAAPWSSLVARVEKVTLRTRKLWPEMSGVEGTI
jgi:hypothetical protein